jgi:hypothetical protein
MITGELKSKIDRIWDAFWSGGISNPLEVIEQITYLLTAYLRTHIRAVVDDPSSGRLGPRRALRLGLGAPALDRYESATGHQLTELERECVGPYTAAVPLYLASIAGHTPDPVRHLLRERPFIAIAEWLLNRPVPL